MHARLVPIGSWASGGGLMAGKLVGRVPQLCCAVQCGRSSTSSPGGVSCASAATTHLEGILSTWCLASLPAPVEPRNRAETHPGVDLKRNTPVLLPAKTPAHAAPRAAPTAFRSLSASPLLQSCRQIDTQSLRSARVRSFVPCPVLAEPRHRAAVHSAPPRRSRVACFRCKPVRGACC